MDHLALSSSITKTTPFLPITRHQLHLPAATVSCRAATNLGSRSGRGTTDFYRLLSITSPKSVGCDEIKRAYRSMALRYHPDVCRDPSKKEEVTEMFVRLNEAYRTLSDPVLRSEYDFELGLGCEDFVAFSSETENRKSDLERQFERAAWRDQTAEMKCAQDEASELRRRSTCRTAKKGHNRMRR
uniref:J domain-containing protein n=1 Tax=Kalanchoe fedtschenkoi TaxID=63787 RepID=A0A7N0UQ52_KALFE